jgi:hypothetical protein
VAETLYALTAKDLQLLREMEQIVARLRTVGPEGFEPQRVQSAPDVYVAYPQETTGIPARADDTPGIAWCDLYALRDDGTLARIGDANQHPVYNLSTEAIGQDYVLVHRTKHGRWVTAPTASGSLYELVDNLGPGGGSATAHPVVWDPSAGGGAGAYAADAGTEVEVRDTTEQFWGLIGEWIHCRSITSDDGPVIEVVEGGAPWYEGTLQAQLNAGSTAACHVTIRGATVDLTVTDRFLGAGEHLDDQTRVGITPDVENGRWTVTEAPCPA